MELRKKELSNTTRVLLGTGIDPQDGAMMQALYSRSAESAEVHYAKTQKVGSGKFMSKYYVGYGHPSIADCGSITLFFEGVSMLAAKAIQQNSLYSGQETSTRYINVSDQPMYEPEDRPDIQDAQAVCMSFYRKILPALIEKIRNEHPLVENEDPKEYERAVNARAFDIARAWIPAGMKTQLSWHTNMRQATDHLHALLCHPLKEVRDIAYAAVELLSAKYPETFSDLQRRKHGEWNCNVRSLYTYVHPTENFFRPNSSHLDHYHFACVINDWYYSYFKTVLETRPRGCLLPQECASAISAEMAFDIDFGSFRDIQRHRNGLSLMPLLMAESFEQWYLDELPEVYKEEAAAIIDRLRLHYGLRTEHTDSTESQYAIPMGFKVRYHATKPLTSVVYMLEMRCGKTVHPTLRSRMLQLAKEFKRNFPKIALHVDTDPDDWTVRRGAQTILEKWSCN